MKRLAMAAFLLLAASSAPTEAGSLPKPRSLTDRETQTSQTHYVRGTRKVPEPVRDGSRDSQGGIRLTHAVRGK